MHAYNYIPKGENRLSDLYDVLDVEQRVDRQQGAHLALGIAMSNVDMFMDDSEEKHDVLKGIWQAWDYLARKEGVDPTLRYNRSSTGVDLDGGDDGDGDHELAGQRIVAVREMSQTEVEDAWAGANGPQHAPNPMMLELESGTYVIPAQNARGGGPGALFGREPSGDYTRYLPE
mgnify:CR=1 FL=1